MNRSYFNVTPLDGFVRVSSKEDSTIGLAQPSWVYKIIEKIIK
jgi:hypothetical protein